MHTLWASERQVPPHTICDPQLKAQGEERAEHTPAVTEAKRSDCELQGGVRFLTLPIESHDVEHLSQPNMLSL